MPVPASIPCPYRRRAPTDTRRLSRRSATSGIPHHVTARNPAPLTRVRSPRVREVAELKRHRTLIGGQHGEVVRHALVVALQRAATHRLNPSGHRMSVSHRPIRRPSQRRDLVALRRIADSTCGYAFTTRADSEALFTFVGFSDHAFRCTNRPPVLRLNPPLASPTSAGLPLLRTRIRHPAYPYGDAVL